MTLLWIAFGLLLLPAVWLLVTPLRQAPELHRELTEFEASDTTAEQNVAVFKRRLASLEAALARGDIDHERYAEDRLELERSLLEDTEASERRPLQPATAGRFVIPLVMVMVVVAAVVWYQYEGAEGDLALYAVQQEVESHPEGSLEMYVERMEEQAQRQPDNPNVWSALFPIYRETGRIPEAVNALERLIAIEGRVAPLLAQLAQIRFFMAGRELTPEVQALVDETLALDPRQPTVLGLLGIEAFDRGDYETAVDRWRRAIASVGDPNTEQSLREGIRIAQQHMGIAPDDAEAVASGPGINVRVSLDPTLAEMVDEDATVFITARDTEGELPPLAVIRTTAAELPMTVTLDDTTAMSPQARLSMVDEARLMVRVSSSGQATPQPGDLFGELSRTEVTAEDGEPVEVVIDRVFE
ncbi:c-type cytochrome biogenesis protein CcmI [Halomonas sp. Bachu 37]|uniref:c-type cytochrome biogenesis protein CcmI n=1 Tax=Halomonas kashgarensis TaxID=3084920 RepID=UPI0032178D58